MPGKWHRYKKIVDRMRESTNLDEAKKLRAEEEALRKKLEKESLKP